MNEYIELFFKIDFTMLMIFGAWFIFDDGKYFNIIANSIIALLIPIGVLGVFIIWSI